jgi:hypothetical protein
MFKVRQTIEKQLVTCPFMGTDLQINKYIIGPLQQVEKEIKESDDPEVKNFVFKDMSTYNRRNVK